MEKVKSKERVEIIEEKTITNYLFQEKRIHGGFTSQGEAMYEMGEYAQVCSWVEKGLDHIGTVEKEMPLKMAMERKYHLYNLQSVSLHIMPRNEEANRKLEESMEMQVGISREISGEESY